MTEKTNESAEKDSTKEYDHIHNLRAVEALLFASAEPVHVSAIRERVGDDVDVGGIWNHNSWNINWCQYI